MVLHEFTRDSGLRRMYTNSRGGNSLMRHTRRMVHFVCVFSFATLVMQHAIGHRAVAQTTVNQPSSVVEVPLQRLNQIQQELDYLRARDAERQAWEHSIIDRLPETDFDFVSDTYASGADGGYLSITESAQKSGNGCKSCGGYHCGCPLTPAPCIDCPRVSTLSPYFNVHIFGALKLDMLFNGGRPISPGTPFYLLPGSALGFSQNTVDIHARQSTLGAAFTGPQVGSFQSGGLVMAMFFNDSVILDQYGFLPLQAYGELKNEDWRFAAGLQFDVFNPGVPTMLPFSALAASGNSGNSFRGQVRVERFLHPADDVQWTLQGALSEPITTTIDPTFGLLNEDAGWPNLEGRVALGVGALQQAGLATYRPVEFGVSGVVGQLRTLEVGVRQVVADVWGVGTDFRWMMTESSGITGEFFTGQSLGTYNAGILQTTNRDTFLGVRSTGGWLEYFQYWNPCLHSHFGYGIDDPLDRDVALGSPLYNSTIYSNLLWDVNSTFRVGFEVTWRQTQYRVAPDKEAAGFHTQFQWSF